MTLALRVVRGARAGATERFEGPVVAIGRHPTNDFRFDPQEDLDVSARHAELRRGSDGGWTLHDLGSTNGTFVNDERVVAERPVAVGDRIAFGAKGPIVEVIPPRENTDVRIAAAVKTQTASLRLAVGALVVVAVTGALVWQRQEAARARALAAPVASAPSAPVASNGGIDLTGIHARNDAAVAMVASDLDGSFLAGTAFGVDTSGELLTNRHVVQTAAGNPARRIRVIYANTTDWLPAHVVRASGTDDLALIQVDAPGSYPVVESIGGAADSTRVGAPVATIGYPLAVSTPMEGKGLHVTARTTTAAGTVSKQLADVLQIDSYAGKGSSGSPVFDAAGRVIGVVYGGAAESGGRIVYAVPGARVAAFLGNR